VPSGLSSLGQLERRLDLVRRPVHRRRAGRARLRHALSPDGETTVARRPARFGRGRAPSGRHLRFLARRIATTGAVPSRSSSSPRSRPSFDELYGAPPEDFVRALSRSPIRNPPQRPGAAAEAAGQVEAAARIKQLRKPTVPLWAVNQLGATSPRTRSGRSSNAGDRLRAASKQPPR